MGGKEKCVHLFLAADSSWSNAVFSGEVFEQIDLKACPCTLLFAHDTDTTRRYLKCAQLGQGTTRAVKAEPMEKGRSNQHILSAFRFTWHLFPTALVSMFKSVAPRKGQDADLTAVWGCRFLLKASGCIDPKRLAATRTTREYMLKKGRMIWRGDRDDALGKA